MRIVLCYPAEDRHLEWIQAVSPDATLINAGQDGIATEIFGADVYCGHAKVPIDWDAVVRQGRLMWIQSSAAGIDHCLVPPVADSQIRVTSASGLFAEQVAEHAMALILGQLRSLPTFVKAQQQRSFVRRPTGDLAGKTVGIVGFGGNGRRLAQIMSAFDVRLIATDVFPVDRPGYVNALWPEDKLERLLSASDIVIVTVPLTDATTALIDANAISVMKSGAMLVNIARGPVVVERALVAALKSGQLSAAALDVTEIEPLPESSELWSLPNVLITPHVGAQSGKRLDMTTRFFCQNLRRFTSGAPLVNLVDKSLGFPRPEHRYVPATELVRNR